MTKTIKDDKKCKICGKKLTEHSTFYDDHKYVPAEKKEKKICPIHNSDCVCTKEEIEEAIRCSEEYDSTKQEND